MGEVLPRIHPSLSLDSTQYKEIVLSNVGTVLMQCRDQVDVTLANSAVPGPIFTLKAGQGIEINCKVAGSLGLWAKSQSGVHDLEIIYLDPE